MNTTILAIVLVEAATILIGAFKLSFVFGKFTAELHALTDRMDRHEEQDHCDTKE